MKYIFKLMLCFLAPMVLSSQENPSLEYYLPKISYDKNIPTPAAWLGYEVGEWHASHDQLLGYIKVLAAASDRLELQEYGRSYENRALVCLIISDPKNLAKKEAILAQRQQLASPELSQKLDLQELPAVNYMGYSIHGNETSGSNAAFLVAYYLAAGQSPEISELLKNTVILLDPCFNPDGMQRFSTWVNSHKSRNNTADPNDDEYNEPWPRGRTNHYGFDLNRDWLVTQQQESKGRVAIFQAWKPNVLTDHHEMGSNASFFFQPGIPTRVNPITPDKNQQLTSKIADYHAKILSKNKVLFYSGESYDDFYYGKGSTYPDVQGSIGILFEQGSSRGTAQETDNGLLTFPYSIRNQVFSSLSTLSAVKDMRVELNSYLRDFHTSAVEEAKKSAIRGYLFSVDDLPARDFLRILDLNGVKMQYLKEDMAVAGKSFKAENTRFVPCEQAKYRLIRAMFERTMEFKDSIFYDISAWTLPDAYGLNWAEVSAQNYKAGNFKQSTEAIGKASPGKLRETVPYAYILEGQAYETPKYLYKLLESGVRVKVAMKPFVVENNKFEAGSFLIAADRQALSNAGMIMLMSDLESIGAKITTVEQGMSTEGPDLGSNNFDLVRVPKVMLLTGDGVNVASSGEIWHLLDTRYDIPVTNVDTKRFAGVSLKNYNVLVLPEGNYPSAVVEKIKDFVKEGGTVVATGDALNWLKTSKIISIEQRKSSPGAKGLRPYDAMGDDKGALAMPGAIFEADLDLSHPICFGYSKSKLPIFMGDTTFISPGKNAYSTPVVFTDNPLLAGYVHKRVLTMAPGAAGALVFGIGSGKIIGFPGNPNFRAFWYGTNRMFANAILLGNLISSRSTERN